MKLLLIFLLAFNVCFGGDFYVATNGSDGNPGTQASPWQTVGKVNSTPVSGDKVHFQGGQVFYGALTPKSGVTCDSYGTGRATITGFTTITSWTSLSNGLYETSISSQVNMVLVNDNFQPIGRWPKMSASNKGYLTYNSHGGSSVTSSGLAGSPSFVGGEVVVRNCHWILNRYPVTSQSSSTVTFSGSQYQKTEDGNGFFFQNHVNACTQAGDWMWAGGKLKIFGQGTVKAATIATLVTLSGKSNITFTNLIFSGSNTSTVSLQGSHHINFSGCDLLFNGTDAIKADMSTNNISLLNCTINWTNNNAVNAGTSPNWIIRDCSITNTGSVAGMGGSSDGKYTAIYDISTNSLVEHNKVENTGYVAINFSSVNGNGGGVIVKNNFVNGFCLVKDDGGAIYTWGKVGTTSLAQRQVTNNIIINGKGAPEGAGGGNTSAHGIYMDDRVVDVTVSGNTCANNAGSGIYLHNAFRITINDNTTFNQGNIEIRCMQDDDAGKIRGINMNGNIFFNLNKETASYQNFVMNFRSTTNDIDQWGTWDNNYYCRPLTNEALAITARRAGTDFFGTLPQWKSLSGKDGSSKSTPVAVTDPNKVRLEYNESKLARVAILPGTWIDVKGIVYSAHITLAPYSSAVLIQTSGTPPPPTTYQSVAKSGSFTRNNCPAGSTGSTVIYSVPSGKYTSTVSQTDADNKAVADVSANGQPYANTNGVCTTVPPVTYSSASKSGTFTRNNCPIGQTGSQVTYTVVAGKYTSQVSQADADSKAISDVNTNGQGFANTNGTCSTTPPMMFSSAAKSGTYTRNNCQSGYTGSKVTYSIPAGKYSSSVSQGDADSQAQGDVNANGQTYANQNGTCTKANCSFWDKLFRRNGCRF